MPLNLPTLSPLLRRLLYLAFFLLAALWSVLTRPAADALAQARTPAPQTGFPAPAFTLSDLEAQPVDLASLQGSVVVLNFWASWCPPCRAEMPAFEQLYLEHQDAGLVVLAVNASNQDDPASIQAFLSALNPTFPILLDEVGAVTEQYAVRSFPTTFFIGRDGVIRDVVVGGPLTLPGLTARVDALLQEAP